MTISTVSQALTFPNKTPLEAIKGTLKFLDNTIAKGGEGDKAWTRQDGLLADGAAEIRMKFWNQPEIPQTLKGQQVMLKAKAKKDGKGVTGLSINSYEKDGKTTNTLDVRSGATIEIAGQPAAPAENPKPPTQQSRPQPQSSSPHRNGSLGQAKTDLLRITALYVDSYKLGLYAVDAINKATGDQIGQDQFQAMVSSIFIQGTYQRLQDAYPPLDVSGTPPWEQRRRAAVPPPAPSHSDPDLPPEDPDDSADVPF